MMCTKKAFSDHRKQEGGRGHNDTLLIACSPCVLACLTRAARKSSTKEYSYFRRLWDDSGGLTRINNAFHGDCRGSDVGRSTRGTFRGNWMSGAREPDCEGSVDDVLASPKVESIESRARLSRNSTMRTPEQDVTLPPPPPSPSLLPPKKQKICRRQQASVTCTINNKSVEASKEETAKAAKAAAAAVWDEAMRSEWSSPSEKIISAAVLTAKAEAAAAEVSKTDHKAASRTTERREHKNSISTSAASVSSGEEQFTTKGQRMQQEKISGDSAGGRVMDNLAKPATFVRRAIGTTSSISCGEDVVGGVRSLSWLSPVTLPVNGVLATSAGDRKTATTTASSNMSEKTMEVIEKGYKEIPPLVKKPGLGDETTEPPGNSFRYNYGGYGDSNGGCGKSDGSCGGGLQSGARKAVRWGRLDLFSVLYPPPRQAGSGECVCVRARVCICAYLLNCTPSRNPALTYVCVMP